MTRVHKKLRSEPNNYRPISLLSVISKMIERIIAEQLTNYLKDHHLESPRQFGFRRGRSISDLFLVASRADSHVGTDGHYRGPTASVLQLPVRQESARRCQQVHFSKLPCRGFGSVLGPILWNIYFNDLLQSALSASAYADDCTFSWTYAREKLQDVVQSVNKQLTDIMAWGDR